jgi:hypothetical protein
MAQGFLCAARLGRGRYNRRAALAAPGVTLRPHQVLGYLAPIETLFAASSLSKNTCRARSILHRTRPVQISS